VLEVAAAIVVAVLVLIYLGEFVVVAASLFGLLLVGVAAVLVFVLRLTPAEVGWGIVVGSIVIATIAREASSDSKADTRPRHTPRD
jgi:hypothetical protein